MSSVNSVPMTIPRLTPAFDQAESANDLFEKFFSWRLSSSPEFATVLGIEGYDDKLGKEMNRNMSEIFQIKILNFFLCLLGECVLLISYKEHFTEERFENDLTHCKGMAVFSSVKNLFIKLSL